jgi:hypothetical protein
MLSSPVFYINRGKTAALFIQKVDFILYFFSNFNRNETEKNAMYWQKFFTFCKSFENFNEKNNNSENARNEIRSIWRRYLMKLLH